MKNLILIRHAKSCWNTPVNDRDRTLANRGIRDAHLVSAHFVDHLPKSFILYSNLDVKMMLIHVNHKY